MKMKLQLTGQRQNRSSSTSTLPPHRFNPCSLIGMKSLFISVSSLCLFFQIVYCASPPRFQSSSIPDSSSGSSNKVPSSPLWPDGLYTQSSYYYADYKIPQPPPKPKFIPDPPSCPETGRTVCQEVEKYPS